MRIYLATSSYSSAAGPTAKAPASSDRRDELGAASLQARKSCRKKLLKRSMGAFRISQKAFSRGF